MRRRGRAIAAIVLSEIPALLLIYASARGFGKPTINDITTDLAEPPNLVHAQSHPGNTGRDMVYPEAFKDLVRAVILIGIFILGIKQAFPDADIGALVTTSAILSVVIGLALQESLSNIFAGLMLTPLLPVRPAEPAAPDPVP